jgi:hypothetical protein
LAKQLSLCSVVSAATQLAKGLYYELISADRPRNFAQHEKQTKMGELFVVCVGYGVIKDYYGNKFGRTHRSDKKIATCHFEARPIDKPLYQSLQHSIITGKDVYLVSLLILFLLRK